MLVRSFILAAFTVCGLSDESPICNEQALVSESGTLLQLKQDRQDKYVAEQENEAVQDKQEKEVVQDKSEGALNRPSCKNIRDDDNKCSRNKHCQVRTSCRRHHWKHLNKCKKDGREDRQKACGPRGKTKKRRLLRWKCLRDAKKKDARACRVRHCPQTCKMKVKACSRLKDPAACSGVVHCKWNKIKGKVKKGKGRARCGKKQTPLTILCKKIKSESMCDGRCEWKGKKCRALLYWLPRAERREETMARKKAKAKAQAKRLEMSSAMTMAEAKEETVAAKKAQDAAWGTYQAARRATKAATRR